MTDLHELDWPTVPLGSLLIDIQPGFASGKHNSTGEGLPHFRPMNVSIEGRIEPAVLKYVDPAIANRPERRLKRGDVVFNNTNSPELVGKTALFDGDDEPAFSNHMTRLRVEPSRLDPGFLAVRLHQAWREGWFAAHCNNHVSQASIGRDVLQAFEIELPPLDVQRAISALNRAVDDRRASSTGHLVAARRAVSRFRQAVLAAACSGQLTDEWRETNPDLEPAEVLIERSIQRIEDSGGRPARYEAAAPEFIKTPASWEWAPLGWLGAIKGGIQKQPKRAPKQNAYPYLRVANVHRGQLDLREIHEFELFGNELETYRLEPGDLLVVEGNGSLSEIGRSALWRGEIENCVHQNHIIRVRCIEVEPAYVDLFWNSPFGSREIQDLAVTSAGLYSLSAKKIASFTVPVPPIEEQREIVGRVDQLLAGGDRLWQRIDLASTRVDRSSQAVLAKAFRGELSANGDTRSSPE